MLKKNKVISIAALALLSLGVSGLALAGNSSDTYFVNEYRVWSPYDHTNARVKYDTSAYYNKTSSITGGDYINVWASLADGTDVSGGRAYKSWAGGKAVFLWNSAVENYGSGVSVRVDSSGWINGSATGVWSPDSV